MSFLIVSLNIYQIRHRKTCKMLRLRVFGPPRHAPYHVQACTTHFLSCIESTKGAGETMYPYIDTSLSSWSREAEFVKNIKERDIIYWVQGLWWKVSCSWREGSRGIWSGKMPERNFNDNVLNPVAASLRAKKVYCNIRDVCIRDAANCLPATPEEAKRLADVICDIAKLAHRK